MEIHDPHDRGERDTREPRSEDDKGARPETLVDGEHPMPHETEHHGQRASGEQSRETFGERPPFRDPPPRELAEHRRADRSDRREKSFRGPGHSATPEAH